MPPTDAERIVIEIVADAERANREIKGQRKLINDLTEAVKATNMSFREVGDIALRVFPHLGDEIKKAVRQLENGARATAEYRQEVERLAAAFNKVQQAQNLQKAKTSVGMVGTQFDLQNAAAEQRALRAQRQIESQRGDDALKLAGARAALQEDELSRISRLASEEKLRYGQAIKAQEELNRKIRNGTASLNEYAATLPKLLKPASVSGAQSIAPNVFNPNTVAQVKSTMAEIQAITKLEAGKVANIMRTMFPNIDTRNIEAAKRALQGIKPAAEQAGQGLWSLKNIARTALGTLEAMAIFLVAKFVGDVLRKTIESVSQLEQSFIKLAIAERAISAAGVDITPKQLADIAKQVADTYETVSQIDAAKMTSNLAVLTKDLGLSADQYMKLAMAIPLVAQQAGVTMDNAAEQVINGLTKSGRGWADLGITVDAAIIRQRAVTDGIVESAEAYDKLTAEQKQTVEVQALINILLENTNENLKEQDNYLKTIEGSSNSVKASWEDMLSKAGQIFRPVIISALQSINESLKGIDGWLESNKQSWADWSGAIAFATTVAAGMVQMVYKVLRGGGVDLSQFSKIYQDALAAMREASTLAATLGELPEDTPTAPSGGEPPVDDSKLKDALEKMNNEILEAQLKLAQDMEEAAIDLGRKLVDITTEYAKKRADAERDYSNKVADINSSYRSRIASINASQAQANQQARNQELEREAKFQNQMQELKEKFLMDLEDALHARDARQILRLIKQYNLEKTQAEREHALEQENSARDNAARNKKFAQERADAERERREKLAEAQRDYADKLAKLAADEQAERDAAELAYQRKKEDLEREMQDRLEIVAANLVAEFNLTKEGLDAILALYQKYYSEVAAIYQAMNAMMMGQQNLQGATITSKGGGGSGGGNKGIMKAEGGMVIADRPTTVTFGENNEPEMGFFAPLGRTGRDVNKVFSNMSGSGASGVEGTIGLDVFLSPDLEARIVKNALGQTAQIVTKIRRSK